MIDNRFKFIVGSCGKNPTIIGESQRHLADRFRDHLSGNSTILEHVSSCNACNYSTIEDFNILTHGSKDFDNKVK